MQTLTKYQKAYQILKQLEYGKRPEKFLHQNKNEEYLTLGGCYEKFWKTQVDWEFVHKIYTACSYDMKRASTMLFNDSKTRAVNTVISEFVYGSLGVDNQIAEVGDYLIIDDEDKLVEVVTEAEFAEKYSVK